MHLLPAYLMQLRLVQAWHFSSTCLGTSILGQLWTVGRSWGGTADVCWGRGILAQWSLLDSARKVESAGLCLPSLKRHPKYGWHQTLDGACLLPVVWALKYPLVISWMELWGVIYPCRWPLMSFSLQSEDIRLTENIEVNDWGWNLTVRQWLGSLKVHGPRAAS